MKMRHTILAMMLILSIFVSGHTVQSNPESPLIFQYSNTYEFTIRFDQPENISTVKFYLNDVLKSKYPNSTMNKLGDYYKTPIFRALPVGNHSIKWVANDSNGNLQIEEYNYAIIQHSYDNPLDMSLESQQIAYGEQLNLIINYQPTGLHQINSSIIDDLWIQVYSIEGDSRILLINTSNYLQVSQGIFTFTLPIDSYLPGEHAVVAYLKTNEFGVSQLLSAEKSFLIINKDTVKASATWYVVNETLYVDALYTGKNQKPISKGICNISLIDQNGVEIITQMGLEELIVDGQTHYITSLNLSDYGTFHGQVECGRSENAPKTSGKTQIQRKEINASININKSKVVNQINVTQNELKRLLERQNDFTQEEILLVTDAFNSLNSVMIDVSSGKITPQEAEIRTKSVRQSVKSFLTDAGSVINASVTEVKKELEKEKKTKGMILNQKESKFPWVIMIIMALCCVIFLVYQNKKNPVDDY